MTGEIITRAHLVELADDFNAAPTQDRALDIAERLVVAVLTWDAQEAASHRRAVELTAARSQEALVALNAGVAGGAVGFE